LTSCKGFTKLHKKKDKLKKFILKISNAY